MNQQITPMVSNGILKLPHLGIIKAIGPEAASFLNGQLSNDLLHMTTGEVKPAAYCASNGKMLASFIVIKTTPETFLLICSADILESVLKRLSMFVLRAKVQLSHANDYSVYGLIKSIDLTDTPNWGSSERNQQLSIQIPSVQGFSRELLITSDEIPLHGIQKLNTETWHWLYISSGMIMINQSLYDQYIPQMLNYESIGAISFNKGCYPGQEVISRSQFRGTLKRRAYLIHTTQKTQEKQEIFTIPDSASSEKTESIGNIIATAPNPQGGWDAIAVLRLNSLEDRLTLSTVLTESNDSTKVTIKPLPYALRDDF